MYYHTFCGHIIEGEADSMMVSERGWKDYTHMYLSNCPTCNEKYPYMKYLDDSVSSQVEEIIYRLLSAGFRSLYIPTFQNPVRSIRLVGVKSDEIDTILNHDSVETIDEYDSDTLISISR